jgi:carboxylesterase type B
MFNVVTFAELKENTQAHTTPSKLDTFAVFDARHNYCRIFSTKEEAKPMWGTEQEMREAVKELDIPFIMETERDQTLTERIKTCIDTSKLIKNRIKLIEDTYICPKGAVKWKSSDNCVPSDYFRDCLVTAPETQQAVDKEDTEAFLAKYRESQANRTPEQIAEHQAEMRAAFGEGQTIVNVITGERVRT